MGITLGIHITYSVYKGILTVWYQSAWFGATAVYYLAVAMIRAFLFRKHYQQKLLDRETYRICGWLLLALTIFIGGVNFYTIRDNQATVYPWHFIYGAAAYTFYSLTATLIQLFRQRKVPLLVLADRKLSLAAALVALFSLQAALLAAFGGEGFPQRAWNSATGFAVVLIIMVIAWGMLRQKPQQ